MVRRPWSRAGALVERIKGLCPFGKLHLDIARRTDDAKGFQLVRKHWIVERTFGWLSRSHRFPRDCEQRTDRSQAHNYICRCRIILKRLVGN